MTIDEALAKWTHCRQCSCWKGNYTPEENDGQLSRKLMPKGYQDAEIVEVTPEGMWPNAQYSAMVKVSLPARKSGPDENAVVIPEKHLFYLAVRKEG